MLQTETSDMTNHRFRQALARTGIFLISLALTACASAATATSASPGFTGYDWQVTAIAHDGKVTAIPARTGVDLQFSPGGQFGANDGINFHSGTYRATADGFSTGVLAVTAMGYAGNDPFILLARSAMASLGNPATYPARLNGDRLVVSVGSYTLTCRRASRQADAPKPVHT